MVVFLNCAILHSSLVSVVSEEAPKLTLQEIIAQAGIEKSDILDQVCSQQVLLSLAKHCVDWQLIGYHLELTKADIVAVGEGSQTPEKKQVEMLEKWKEKFSSNATYRVFIEALLYYGKCSAAIEACKAIVSSK